MTPCCTSPRLQYLRARYYDPVGGSFLTRDPMSATTRAPYGYAGNWPVNASDPTGKNVLQDLAVLLLQTSPAGGIPACLGMPLATAWVSEEHDLLTSNDPAREALGAVNVFALVFSAGTLGPEEAVAEGMAGGVAEGVGGLEEAAVNGETAATAAGGAAHKATDYGDGFEKEFRLPSGSQFDAINFEDRLVLELKPSNMRAIYRGLNQVDRYLEELNREFPGETPWQGQVVTYGG